ncbi:hypothetical protein GJ744_008157 [Endocarpon pusillum]|uniref:Uncharacterized protein n=1 Tax=Endocarpon pusillum TaxID=364733 RepID=A0A8H7E5T0_9EURO|nr:hypothetical protein GJ744_008157 [Endocarpon pusillum]
MEGQHIDTNWWVAACRRRGERLWHGSAAYAHGGVDADDGTQQPSQTYETHDERVLSAATYNLTERAPNLSPHLTSTKPIPQSISCLLRKIRNYHVNSL